MSSGLPEGTVTFLFTDIEGSTHLLQQLGAGRYGEVLAAQRTILRAAFAAHNGAEIDTQGDAFFVSFPRASQAVAAAVEIQRTLAAHAWPDGAQVRVRMGLHSGEPLVAGKGYVGIDVHRAARIAHIAHGGQVLLSLTSAELARGDLPEGVSLLDLGVYRFKDIERGERIHQLSIEGLDSSFPALKARLVRPPAEPGSRKPVSPPAFLQEDASEAARPQPVFVGRERELAWLDGKLDAALAGQGHAAFLSGSAGQGKTALMERFALRSMDMHEDLLVISGYCDAYTGLGDPYHPWRAALAILAGDVESRWARGAVTTSNARQLWDSMALTGRALIERGSDLIGTFLNGQELFERAETAGLGEQDWTIQLHARLQEERLGADPGRGDSGQAGLFEQVAKVLAAVAAERPLVITLDDLQWADRGSLDLLAGLGRELAGARILLLGAYRPDEISLGREGERHPLEKVLTEFKRQHGEVELELGRTVEREGRAFVEAYLDCEPNHLSPAFREALFAHTQGHPLFTVELLRALQERGDLLRDEDGYWIDGPRLDWGLLPSRIEGVIEERINRLEGELRELLTIASVEGEDFTAQVVARVRQAGEQGVIRQLSRELDKKHRLIGEQGSRQIGKQKMHLYRFRHSLTQQHVYNGLTENEKELLHAEVGTVLEALYGKEAEKIAPQLAWHFTMAGEPEKALPYLLQAGDRARQLFAHAEAIEYYERALAAQKETGRFEAAASTLMRLGLALQTAGEHRRASQAFDQSFSLRRQASAALREDLLRAPHPLRRFFLPRGMGLDPGIQNSDFAAFLLGHLFSGLLRSGPNWTIQPEIAREWKISDDGRRYVFHLRQDVGWSDGQPVTAHDFETAWKRILDPKTGAVSPDMIYAIRGAREFHQEETSGPDSVGVRAVEPYTLEVELEEPAAYFLNLLTMVKMAPVPRHAVERYGPAWTEPEHLVTNGPFLLKAWIPGEKIILERNPAYFGEFGGNLTEIEFIVDPNLPEVDRLAAYRAGRVDVLFLTAETYYARYQHPAEYYRNEYSATSILGYGQVESPFRDRRVRQAFALAVDKEFVSNKVFGVLSRPATGGFLPPGFPGHSPDIGLPFNPGRARQLLAEAGYPDRGSFPEVDILAPKSPMFPGKTAQALQSCWIQHLGVRVYWKVLDTADFDILYQQSALYVTAWVPDYPDPDTFMRVGVRGQTRFWQHPDYDRLIREATRIGDPAERLRLYRQADRILMEEAAIVPIDYLTGHILVKPWVKKIEPGWWDARDIIIEPH